MPAGDAPAATPGSLAYRAAHGLRIRRRIVKTAIITGANAGLGLGCAGALLDSGPDWHVVLAVRDAGRGAAAVAELGRPERCSVLELDLASLASVARFVAAYPQQDLPPAQAIVCNAGIQFTGPVTQLTEDGIETTFAVNHLGHHALVTGLLDGLQASARILVVASDTHDPARRTGMPKPAYTTAERLAHPAQHDTTDGRRRYTTSKLCNVLFAYELNRRLDAGARGIAVNAFNPGLMPGSGLARDAGPLQRFAWHAIMPALRVLPQVRSAGQSGRDLAALVSDPAYEGVTGRYFDGRRDIRSSVDSFDLDKAADLWRTSEALVRDAASGDEPHLAVGLRSAARSPSLPGKQSGGGAPSVGL